MTAVYLAYGFNSHETLRRHAGEEAVDILVSLPSLKDWTKNRHEYNVARWVLDSGAFSAFYSGLKIELADYIAICKDVDAAEVFGLDVIRDVEGTKRNLDAMWSAGVPAIPTFHQGEPWAQLEWCARSHPKIAISGKLKNRHQWIMECFRRVWPKPIHGFAYASWADIRLVPWHSVDASSWVKSPGGFGNWAGYTGTQMAIRSRRNKDYWIEAIAHQKRAAWARFRWRKQLALCESMLTKEALNVRTK